MTGFLDFSAGRRRGSPVSPHRECFVGFDDFNIWEIGLEGGEVGVAFVGFVYVANQPFVDLVAKNTINFGTADDKNFLIGFGNFGRAVDDIDAVVFPIAIAGEDDVAALGERATDGFKGFSAHQDWMAEGGFFEEREILG